MLSSSSTSLKSSHPPHIKQTARFPATPHHKPFPTRHRSTTQAQRDENTSNSPWPSSTWPRSTSTTDNNNNSSTTTQQTPSPPSSNGTSSSTTTTTISYINTKPHAHPIYPSTLSGDDFRHPLDQQNTALLRALPGLEMLARSMMGPVAEQILLLENISTSVKVGPNQLPSLNALMVEAAGILRMETPDLYVRANPVPNAYTLAIAGRKPFVVVHSSLLDLLTPAEIQSVLAHELGHLKCDHGVWLTAANVLALGTVSLLPVISNAVEDNLWRWLRAAELTCDRAALLVAGDSRVVVSSLMKLAGGSPSFANELNVDAFLEQARSYEEATASPLGWYLRNAQTRALSHPLPVLRAREIDRWARSEQCKKLMGQKA